MDTRAVEMIKQSLSDKCLLFCKITPSWLVMMTQFFSGLDFPYTQIPQIENKC